MKPLPDDLTITLLRDPAAAARLTPAGWDLFLRQARRADLLGRIAHLLEARGLLDGVPAAPRAHFLAARHVAEAQREQVEREVAHIVAALEGLGLDTILLKGSAYALAGLPPAPGRLFSDIDILVPLARLPEVEAILMLGGWATTHLTPYDQRYYREWMHELPPLVHIHRHTMLDVHHAILPRTARLKPDAGKLIAAARPVPGHPGVRVLAPLDMLLHSMAHLTHNEELTHGLRDLSDLDLLLRHACGEPGFWNALLARAVELDLVRPLQHALRASAEILGTPVPEAALRDADAAGGHPPRPMRGLWRRALRTPHPSAGDWLSPAARLLLYMRAHWLRMPPVALARHLAIKAVRRGGPEPERSAARPAA